VPNVLRKGGRSFGDVRVYSNRGRNVAMLPAMQACSREVWKA
jgi:hypothetical protein